MGSVGPAQALAAEAGGRDDASELLMTTLLLLHAAATLAMTGLIWFVQLVHYPMFPYAASGDFTGFAAEHQRRTGWVVVPLMLIEAATATLLLFSPSSPATAWLGWTLLASIWLSTALVQVPLHRRLAGGYDPRAARQLVRSNWLRTALWSARAVIALRLL